MTDAAVPTHPERRNAWLKLYHGETRIDFIGRWKIWFAVSGRCRTPERNRLTLCGTPMSR